MKFAFSVTFPCVRIWEQTWMLLLFILFYSQIQLESHQNHLWRGLHELPRLKVSLTQTFYVKGRSEGQLSWFLIWLAGQTTTCQIIEVLVLLPHASRSTFKINSKRDHLKQLCNGIKPSLFRLGTVSQWRCRRREVEIRRNQSSKDGRREWLGEK